MNDFNNYRGSILNQNGEFINYNIVPGLMHQDIVDDYCNSNNLNGINEDAIVQNGDIYFRNAGNKMFIVYMPENITEEQLYKLELNDYVINNFEYLGVVKQSQRFEFTENIWENFSSEVIQSYFRKNNL